MTPERVKKYALERARIFLRLRRSLRDLFFFHFSLILLNNDQERKQKRRQTRHTLLVIEWTTEPAVAEAVDMAGLWNCTVLLT